MVRAIDGRTVAPTPAARFALLRRSIDRLESLPQVELLTHTDGAVPWAWELVI